MDETLTGKQKLFLLVKEMKIGLLNGGILGIMALALLGIYIHLFKGYTWIGAFGISGCVGISLLVAMVISSLVGTVIPMFFHKIKIDPAVASGPLITTVNDLVAVVTYYGLAFLFSGECFIHQDTDGNCQRLGTDVPGHVKHKGLETDYDRKYSHNMLKDTYNRSESVV